MTFGNPFPMVLVVLPLLWLGWEWPRTQRRLALCVKTAVFTLILLALAQPRLSVPETRMAVALLADSSASIPPAQIEQERQFIQEAAGARGRAELRVLSFSQSARPGAPSGPGLDTDGTNLESALQAAMASLPPSLVPRLVLLSDGNENLGAVERALHQARKLEIPIDTIPLAGRSRPDWRLLALSAPARVFSGESFVIEIGLASPKAALAQAELSAENAKIGASKIRLAEGHNIVRVQARLRSSGATVVRGRVTSPELGDLHFEHSLMINTPSVLLISSDPAQADEHLRQVLSSAGFEIERSAGLPPRLLEKHEVVIANNQDLERWPLSEKQRLEEFVRRGGGFLLIAGENNLYAEPDARTEDPLHQMLPANLAPPRTPEGTAVVLVLDKSSSMEGKKMQLARQSAIGVVDNLRPVDQVGVLVFDNSFQWAVSPRLNNFPSATKQSIASIVADGGTQIAPALYEAYQRIRETNAVYKHLLLLTDGISEEGDSIALAREAAKNKITISTIGLGQDVNRAYLERVAATAEGRSYFLIDVEGLEQLVLQDVREHTGSSVTEREVETTVAQAVEILDRVPLEQAGPLLGWVRFEAKPEAEVLLTVGEDPQDPLLTRWQYGLGRAAVFASDAKDRWAVNWVSWTGFDRFWSNLVRDLLPRSFASESGARYDASSGDIVLTHRFSPSQVQALPASPPEVYVLGPDDLQLAVPMEQITVGRYEARVAAEQRYGLFRFRAASEVESFPEVAFYLANPEREEYGSNRDLLRKIAAFTGGRVDPAPSEIFDPGERSARRSMELWPGLLFAAILLNLLELVGRKGWLPWLGRWA